MTRQSFMNTTVVWQNEELNRLRLKDIVIVAFVSIMIVRRIATGKTEANVNTTAKYKTE